MARSQLFEDFDYTEKQCSAIPIIDYRMSTWELKLREFVFRISKTQFLLDPYVFACFVLIRQKSRKKAFYQIVNQSAWMRDQFAINRVRRFSMINDDTANYITSINKRFSNVLNDSFFCIYNRKERQ